MHTFNNAFDKRQVSNNIPVRHINMTSSTTPICHSQWAETYDEAAKVWFSGYYKCQKSLINSFSPLDRRASMLGFWALKVIKSSVLLHVR